MAPGPDPRRRSAHIRTPLHRARGAFPAARGTLIVGIVPAAGRAERLQPLAGSKEMLPVAGRPVIDHVVERIRAAACHEVRVVARPDKRDVIDHADALRVEVVLGDPATVSESIQLGLESLDGEDVVLLGFPDSLWEPMDGFARLVDALDDEHDVVLGIFHSPEPERSDVVELASSGDVTSVSVKPARPSSDLIWGCAAARAHALAGLSGHDEAGHLFDALAKAGRVRGVAFPGEFTDIGKRAAFARAQALYPGGT